MSGVEPLVFRDKVTGETLSFEDCGIGLAVIENESRRGWVLEPDDLLELKAYIDLFLTAWGERK